ncbi:hypothetical protein [Thiothrix subterranea]|uniref:hypothetical protein n=1 Tax=Thiothrix subterranea TaxID=2735563 RepID=UPI00280BCC25|nr:hypothetical protein [Thiothrix subterranea]
MLLVKITKVICQSYTESLSHWQICQPLTGYLSFSDSIAKVVSGQVFSENQKIYNYQWFIFLVGVGTRVAIVLSVRTAKQQQVFISKPQEAESRLKH